MKEYILAETLLGRCLAIYSKRMKVLSVIKIFDKAIVQFPKNTYLGVVILIAPLLNFLTGINIDLSSPSLPAISSYYGASSTAVQNTIAANMIGFAVGCIIFGTIIDIVGRRPVILLGLIVYIVVSMLALMCADIQQLMIIRFIQGMMVAIASMGCRAIIMDTFTGHKLNVGLLYTSLTYSLGPIIAPLIGGILQYHFGWKANFLAYALFGLLLFCLILFYIEESIRDRQPFCLKTTLLNYKTIILHSGFMAGVFILALGQFEALIYPTVGAFLVENELHQTPIVFGYTALLVSLGYLLGTLANRLLFKKWSLHQLTCFGFVLLLLGALLQIVFAFIGHLNLWTILLPITLIGVGNGFIFSNVLTRCLQLFPYNVGIAIGLLSCLLMAIASIGVFVISHIDMNGLVSLAVVFAVIVVIQLLSFRILLF